MTTKVRNTKLSPVEAAAGDRDVMKTLMKEALQEVLEGDMSKIAGSPAGRTRGSQERV